MSEKTSNFVTSVKIISVLLAICIVCGVLLALCNDLLHIDDETQFNRAMQKVYPDFQRDTTFSETPISSAKDLAGAGRVSKVYRSTDGTYVIEAVGQGGFNSGTVTMYVAIGGTTPNVTIKALGITANVGQSWVAKVDQKSLNTAYVGKNIQDVSSITFGANYKIGGTTYTSTAVLNSVKTAVNYCITGLKLVSTPESEARDAAIALLGSDYDYTTITDETYKTALGYDFYFTAVNDGKSYDVYVYGNADDVHEIVAIDSTLTHTERATSDDAIKAKTDGISDEILAKVRGLSHIESQVQQLGIEGFTCDVVNDLKDNYYESEDGTARITNVYRSNSGAMAIITNCDPGTYQGYSPKTLNLMVVISADATTKEPNKIVNWKVVSVGGHTYYNSKFDEFYKNVDINDTIEYQKVTGATGTSDAIYRIISLCAKCAGEISK